MKDSNGDLTYLVSINSTQRLTDHLGSVVAITDDQGNLISQQRYLPFGGVRTNVTTPNSPNTDFGYTGQRNLDDDIGLMDYKARFYSPVLNRFIQPDSIVPNLFNSQSWNRFSYVVNNPMNLIDPSGHSYCDSPNAFQEDCAWTGNTSAGTGGGGGNGDVIDSDEEEFDLEIGDIEIPEGLLDSQSIDVGDIFNCEFFLSGATELCNADNWKVFPKLLHGDYGTIGYDFSRVDGIEMLIDLGSIVTDLGLLTPFAGKSLKAGIAIDTFGLAYQVSKATEGKSSLIDLGFTGTIQALSESNGISKIRVARVVPVGGSFVAGASIGYNLWGGFYYKPPAITVNFNE